MSADKKRQLVLNVFLMRFGHHPAAWRHPTAKASGRPDLAYWTGLAKLAEDAKFDAYFLADFIGRSSDGVQAGKRNGISYQFEPLTLLSAIGAVTKNIGLIGTVNTNFNEPYNVARKLTSLDHISGGRAGWNIVSSLGDAPSKNFGLKTPLSHAERYARAAEFVDVAKQLWDSWDDDAFDHVDREKAIFYDPSSAHPIKHDGKYFSVEGVLDLPRPIQGYPVFVQAGNSDTGREFAARTAEMTYCSATSLDVAQGYYSDIKGRAARLGRDPNQIKITPGLSVTVAPTDSEAQGRFDELQDLIDFSHVVLAGVDLSGYPLDGPLPELPDVENGKGRRQQLVELAQRENLTIRQLVKRFAVSRGHLQVVGSPKKVADKIEEWFTQGGADGFNVVPPLLPRGFEDFTRLVVPELQRRGLFRSEYTGATLRENMGLNTPADSSRVEKADAA
jgi:FMN-dependent oxidoreductase (nitrilotriacetate monooxygenase family)